MAEPDYLKPFVLPVDAVPVERHGPVDLYLPGSDRPAPAVVFVHGGPIPPDLRPTPRDWPVYRAYGSAVAARGLVGLTVDHRLHSPADYPVAAGDVAEAVEVARADDRVDGDRVAIWFFSGGGLILADWLRDPPPWLRCVAASYPVLAPLAGWAVADRFRPIAAVASAGALPIVVTRAGRERPEVAADVDAFVKAAQEAGAAVEVVDAPNGRHGFDVLDHTDESRRAVRRALDAVAGALGRSE